MSEIPDHAPTVSVSIEYGKYLDNFDVDIASMTAYLQERGVMDEDIANLQIEFSGDSSEKMKGRLHFGDYNRNEDKITITHGDEMQEAGRIGHDIATNVRNEFINRTIVHELEHKISFHDGKTEQASRQYAKKMFRKRTTKPYLVSTAIGAGVLYEPHIGEVLSQAEIYGMHPLKVLGAIAISGSILGVSLARSLMRKRNYKEYRSDPEEVRAYEAESKYDRQFVSFEPKYIDEETPDRIRFENMLREERSRQYASR